MIIDAHTHGFHPDYVDRLTAAGGGWGEKTLNGLMARAKERIPHLCDLDLRLAQLDRNGIDMQVVTPVNAMESNLMPGDVPAKLAYARILNDCMAEFMNDSKGRLLTCGTIPLEGLEQGGLKEMERAVKDLGLKGFSLSSNLNGKPLDLPEFESFWALAAEINIPVYIHPGDPAGRTDRSYEAEYDLIHNLGWPFETELALSRLVFSGIMERHPTLKVVSHHLGGGIPFFLSRTIETYDPPNQQELIGKVLPKPLFDYFSLFYYDTAVGGSAPAIRCAYEVFGADKLVFATDAPFGPGGGENRLTNYPNVVRSLGLSEDENKKIFSENARKILNL